jgi:predicted nucleotidyltransferase
VNRRFPILHLNGAGGKMSDKKNQTIPAIDPVRVRTAMADEADVRLVVLFGSLASGSAMDGSDVDLGVALESYDPRQRYSTIRRLLTSLWGCAPSPLLDLVILNDAGPLLRHRVAKAGTALYERRPGDMVRFITRAVRDYQDTAYHREMFLRQRVRKLKGGLRDGGSRDLLAQARRLGRLFEEDQSLP